MSTSRPVRYDRLISIRLSSEQDAKLREVAARDGYPPMILARHILTTAIDELTQSTASEVTHERVAV